MSKMNFGGIWTEQKLEVVRKYLNAYTIALKKQGFRKIYIDAFSGSGFREEEPIQQENLQLFSNDCSEETVKPGSPLISLSIDIRFDEYHFIEVDKDYYDSLLRVLPSDKRINSYNGDANKIIPEILDRCGKYDRVVIFLDPFSTEVKYKTLKAIAESKIVDLWYLLPLSVILRMLPKSKKPNSNVVLENLLGEDDFSRFYKQFSSRSLIDGVEYQRFKRIITKTELKDYVIEKLKSIFPYVSSESIVLKNSKNSPMFLLLFAVANPSEKAQHVASSIAENILKKSKKVL